MKKALSLFAVLFCLTSHPAWAQTFSSVAPSGQTLYYCLFNDVDGTIAASLCTPTFNNDDYYNNSDTLFWTGYTKPTGNLIIPSTVTYNGTTYPVRLVIRYTFWGCTELTSIDIPNSVTWIDRWSFRGCSSLTTPNTYR